MEFGVKEWLTLIVAVAILVVVLDGIRRMRSARRDNIKVSSNVQVGGSKAELEKYGSELPTGGARVVSQRDESTAEKLNQEVRQSYKSSKTTRGFRIPEQVTLNLDESVPMLMDSVNDPGDKNKPKAEPTLGELDDIDETDVPVTGAPATEHFVTESMSKSSPKLEDDNLVSDIDDDVPSNQIEPEFGDGDDPCYSEPDEVLVINIMAPKGYYFSGEEVLECCVDEGMRFGEMNIFHRHRDVAGKEPILFSMANIVMPGTFNIKEMSNFQTPGVSFFLALPCAEKSMDAFDLLYRTATNLAEAWGGELKDENRSVLTQQTVEHYRQRIRDFERKRLTHAH
ncbi:cell division protein ZipA [Sessilibacter corallicola]|uniref:Cell division protein ZipA n=1 Tax=Sessilibacter corallicola TaxID=2904075 RepID=A0ABQ0AA39_9GAMM